MLELIHNNLCGPITPAKQGRATLLLATRGRLLPLHVAAAPDEQGRGSNNDHDVTGAV